MNVTRLIATVLFALVVGSMAVESIGGESVASLYAKGFELQKSGDLKQALAMYHKCLTLDPKSYKALLASGTVYYAMKDYRKAAQRYELLLGFYPDNLKARLYLAFCRLHLGSAEKARTALELILADHPRDVAATIGLGWAEYLAGNRFTAVDYFKKALALQPDNQSLGITISRLEAANREALKEEQQEKQFGLMSDLNNCIAEAAILRARRRGLAEMMGAFGERSSVEKMALLDTWQELKADPDRKAFPPPGERD